MSLYGEHGHQIDDLDLSGINGAQYASLLRVSHSWAVVGSRIVVNQGKENAVDIDLCDGVHLSGEFGSGPVKGDQAITVKGGSKNYTLSGVLHSRGNRGHEVEIGNWFDQSYRIGGKGNIDLRHSDGKPVRVAIGWVTPFVTKLGPECKYMVGASVSLKVYWIAKFIIRTVLFIPKGIKGPSWF